MLLVAVLGAQNGSNLDVCPSRSIKSHLML